jgi:hypothetical protein
VDRTGRPPQTARPVPGADSAAHPGNVPVMGVAETGLV